MKLTGLSPMLESRDIHATIEFYASVLGFTLRGSFEHEGVTTWCDLVRDEVAIMFSIPNEQMNYERSLLTGSLYINAEDVDLFWEALKDKCEIVYPVENF
ncbi:MAG TPA: VOC family protein, partial [Ferruginibacter sp.]|nr:VOC family protein [Ferruginibacter sp.]